MKKLLVGIIMFVLTISLAMPAKAQEDDFDFARAYQDYVFTQDVYESALSDYRLARSQYLQAQTLVSQSKARDATVEMLQARDDVVIAYLIAIRMKILETAGISDVVSSGISDRLDAEIAWYRDHRSRISSAGDLDDLEKDSDEARIQFRDTTRIIYEALATVADGKIDVLRDELSVLISTTRRKTFEIENNGDFDLSLIQRWLSEADQKVTRSLDKSIEAQSEVQDFYKGGGDKTQLFNKIIDIYQESYQLIIEGNSFLKEIISELT